MDGCPRAKGEPADEAVLAAEVTEVGWSMPDRIYPELAAQKQLGARPSS